MKVAFVAGFGPIIGDTDAALAFWRDGLGIDFDEPAPGYFTNDSMEGVKAFAMWPLSQAAETTFGSPAWPADLPTPQAWMELDVESVEAVAAAVAEMAAAGHRVLRDARRRLLLRRQPAASRPRADRSLHRHRAQQAQRPTTGLTPRPDPQRADPPPAWPAS